jgi:MoaA/NifB/PqqE/SkfB family radical SAM enzyme
MEKVPMTRPEQVFLYVTQRCNIRCVTCYALDQLERGTDLEYDEVLGMLRALHADGAWRLSFLGGEPTVYPALPLVVTAARDIGFSFVRINTNGMFDASLLYDARMRGVDVLCFSIDGATAAVNDSIRKGSRLNHVLGNMRLAVRLGYEVRVNVTITSRNIDYTFEMLTLAQDVGAAEVNLNVLFLMGYALDHQELSVAPAAWRRTYDEVVRRHREFSVRIKLPPAFATAEELPRHRDNGHRCVAADGSRLYAASNGDVYPCLTLMDDPSHRVATFSGGRMIKLVTVLPGGERVHDYCHFINMQTDGLHPLCIFYKERLNFSEPLSPPPAGQAIQCAS